MHRAFRILACALLLFVARADDDAEDIHVLDADDADADEEAEKEALQQKLTHMKLQKTVLEGQSKIATVVRTLQTIGSSADGVFEEIMESADEGNRLLDSLKDTDDWEEKLEIVNQGLAKRSEWIAQLTTLKDAMSEAEEEVGNQKEAVKNTKNNDKPEEDEMTPEVMQRTAKLMVQAVREGKVEMVAKFMSALEKKPEVLAKLVMWADERTGANLLHWCGFYGKEAHALLAQTFMIFPGVNASAYDKHQHTPCHTACKKNHPDVLEHLMTQHASSTPCDPFDNGAGSNCLHMAAQGGHTKILEMLAPRLTTATLEIATGSGVSAMYLAIESGSADAVKILQKAAARLDPKKSREDEVSDAHKAYEEL